MSVVNARRSSVRIQLGRASLGLVVSVVWLGFWGLGILAEFSDHASLWYPPAAFMFAAPAVVGWHMAPFLVMASIASTFRQFRLHELEFGSFSAFSAGVAFATALLLAYGVSAGLLQRLARKARGRLPLTIIVMS